MMARCSHTYGHIVDINPLHSHYVYLDGLCAIKKVVLVWMTDFLPVGHSANSSTKLAQVSTQYLFIFSVSPGE